MASIYESELEAELEQELSGLHEGELEGEGEGEGELGGLLSGLFGEGELEGELEGEGELGGLLGGLFGEGEMEGEGELEFENEVSPVRKIYADAMMEHLAHLAAESETEQEAAEQFLPLIGMAAKKLLPIVARRVAPALRRALPRVARAVTRLEPQLTRGVTRIARVLHRNPGTRGLLRAMPAIARRTVGSIARQAVHGRPITMRNAVRTLANQTRRVLGHPHQRRRALRHARLLDRRFHRQMPGVARPHGIRRHRGWGGVQGGVPGVAHPGVAYPGGYPAVAAPGGVVGRRPGCPVCPHCKGTAICQCCGQAIR